MSSPPRSGKPPKPKMVHLVLDVDTARLLRCLLSAHLEFQRRTHPYLQDGNFSLAEIADTLGHLITALEPKP